MSDVRYWEKNYRSASDNIFSPTADGIHRLHLCGSHNREHIEHNLWIRAVFISFLCDYRLMGHSVYNSRLRNESVYDISLVLRVECYGSIFKWVYNVVTPQCGTTFILTLLFNTLRTGDADLRFEHGETRYICKFSLVPLHKRECFQRYHTLKHY